MRKELLVLLFLSVFSKCAVAQCGNSTVQNYDFTFGNTGFTSNYVNAAGTANSGEYEVAVVPGNSCFTGPDHSSGFGRAMYVNSSTVTGKLVHIQRMCML